MAWDDVRLFLVLYRARTMSEAAATLGVNTSTVSRRLAALEETLDTTLFDRGRDGLRATVAADDLFPTAEVVERGVSQFANAADNLEREATGLVRITCPPDVADVIVLPVLRELAESHPGLRFAIEPGEAMMDLNRREADLALRIVRPTRGDLIVKRVLEVGWRVAAHADLAAEFGDMDSLDDMPWIGWGDRFRAAPTCRWLDTHVNTEPVLRTDSLNTQIAAVKAGLGVALLPMPTIEHFGFTTMPPPTGTAPFPMDELFLVTHRALRFVPRIQVLWDALLAHFDA